MMMEQQTALMKKSDDLQERWKTCIATTCYAYRVVEKVKEAIENFYEIMRQVINKFAEIFRPVVESLSSLFDELKEFVDKNEDFIKYCKSYPQGYPQNVDNLKVNTKGFPRPITHCARSRC